MNVGDAGDVQTGGSRLGRRLRADGHDRHAPTRRGERPGSGAGHDERDVGVRHRGALIFYEDSYGSLALAVSRGSAAELLRLEEGGEIVIHLTR